MLREYDNVKEKNSNKKNNAHLLIIIRLFPLILPYLFDIIRQILYPVCQHSKTTKEIYNNFIEQL